MMVTSSEKEIIVQEVRQILEDRPVFLDTETTGLGIDAQVVDLAVVDTDGTVLLDTLIRPTVDISSQAIHVHGITGHDVAGAPSFAEVLPDLARVLNGRVVVGYNIAYDTTVLKQSAKAHGLVLGDVVQPAVVHCAMLLYAAFWQEWDDYRGSFRWQSLERAARQQGIACPPDLHRARADAKLTRQVFLAMAKSGT